MSRILTGRLEDKVQVAMKTLAVREKSVMVSRVRLNDMKG